MAHVSLIKWGPFLGRAGQPVAAVGWGRGWGAGQGCSHGRARPRRGAVGRWGAPGARPRPGMADQQTDCFARSVNRRPAKTRIRAAPRLEQGAAGPPRPALRRRPPRSDLPRNRQTVIFAGPPPFPRGPRTHIGGEQGIRASLRRGIRVGSVARTEWRSNCRACTRLFYEGEARRPPEAPRRVKVRARTFGGRVFFFRLFWPSSWSWSSSTTPPPSSCSSCPWLGCIIFGSREPEPASARPPTRIGAPFPNYSARAGRAPCRRAAPKLVAKALPLHVPRLPGNR